MARTFAVVLIVLFCFVGYASTHECEGMMGGPGALQVMMMGKGGDMMFGPGMGCDTMMHGGKHKCAGGLIGMREELGLTDAQVKKLKSMKMNQKKKAIDDRAEIQKMELELHEVMSEDEIDIKAVNSIIDKIAAKKAKMQKNCIRGMVDARKVLTSEQKKKLKTCKGAGMKKRMERKVIIKDD
ncbi:hypothetical protein AMJ40_07515 [candidate division TA06 bacterium DG_26]|uniref:Periplasmic heavy metal sensor n=1 Tax=candidate division TA06 bacterium DG_26 TaxID=1703771 RepID=A0A0S7WE60_UNCT6|nr:MAG: hypothetical protein AMJ40_07515 [candidate division TA06 bacterium DG_26]